MKKFSMSEALSFGWNAMKKNFWFFVLLLIIQEGFSMLPSRTESAKPEFAIILIILSVFISTWISLWVTYSQLKIYSGEKGTVKDLFEVGSYYLDYLGAIILYGLLVMAGFILLIVPGIIWAIKYQYTPYLVVEKKLNPIEAMRESAMITSGVKWNLFLFNIVISLVAVVGFFFLFIGVFATVPMAMMAQIFVYKKLKDQAKLPAEPKTAEAFAN